MSEPTADGRLTVAVERSGRGHRRVHRSRARPAGGRQLGGDGRPIYAVRRGNGVAWEAVSGATVVVLSWDASQGQLLEIIDGLEVE